MSSVPAQRVLNTQTVADRSRRGKAQTGDSRLMAVARNPAAVEPRFEAEIADRVASPAPAKTDEHAPRVIAKGVAVGLLISIALWAAIGFAAWYRL